MAKAILKNHQHTKENTLAEWHPPMPKPQALL
jgi:hypothetical protein